MKRKLLVAVPLLCVVALVAFLLRPKHESLSDAYISERSVTLWSSVAQVREQVGVLLYGDHVDVLARRNESVKVRTANGLVGWVDGHYLMEPDLWQRSAKLLKQAATIPVQARGRTKVPTNLRVEPGRNEPRLYQFFRNAPVEIVGRATADWVQVADEKEGGEPAEAKKEDWFLVRGTATRPPGEGVVRNSAITNTTQPGDQNIPIAGWVVARFVSLDLPEPVREGAESANIRALAWFELNRVSDGEGEHPQYLAAGARGPEGMACDFTTLRVYTWNTRKTRYETAFIDNNLCGVFPIRVDKDPKGQPEFRFHYLGEKEERRYHLIQTVVRRVKEETPGASSKSEKAKPLPPASKK
jgi:hypothetical protein